MPESLRCWLSAAWRSSKSTRPDRQLQPSGHGKTDTIDAEAAARSALNGLASGAAKSHDGVVESIRLHRLTLTTLRKSRTALINTLRSVLVTAPAALRDELGPLTGGRLARPAAPGCVLATGALG